MSDLLDSSTKDYLDHLLVKNIFDPSQSEVILYLKMEAHFVMHYVDYSFICVFCSLYDCVFFCHMP